MNALLVALLILRSQQSPPPQTPTPAPPEVHEEIEVVAVTPVHGLGVPILLVPANVQVMRAADFDRRPGAPIGDLLASQLASVHLNETQNNPFQPDVQFRGFTASPLLGSSQGVAIYVDGVRANEPFGDAMNWDLLPTNAIASANLVPGSNPLFGLNALGGALSLETKTGFSHPGHDASVFAGSFGRQWFDVTSGAHSDKVSYFATLHGLTETGWRDYSPSDLGQFFGNVEWREGTSMFGLSVTAGAARLVGNGPAPEQLLELDRTAVFTHPDRTTTRTGQFLARASRANGAGLVEGVFYFRPALIRTFNGDDTTYAPCQEPELSTLLCGDDGTGDVVYSQSGQPVLADPDHPLDATNNTSETRTNGWGGTLQVTHQSSVRGATNRLLFGGTFDRGGSEYSADTELARLDDTRGTVGTHVLDQAAAIRLNSTATHASGYIADFLSVNPRVTISGSARLTQSWLRLRDQLGDELSGDHTFTRLNPSVGVTVDLGKGLSGFASYSEASRVPTPSELGCADPDDPCRLPNAFVSDPPLTTVVARSLEGGVRTRGRRISWSASAFRTGIADDIIFVSSGALTNSGHFANVGDTRRSGIETTVTGSQGRVSWGGAYTYLQARFADALTLSSPNHPDAVDGEIVVAANSRIPGIPEHNLKGSLVVRAGRLSLSTDIAYTSSQYLRGDEANLLDPIDSRVFMNAGVTWRLGSRLRLVGNVTNLLGTDYSTFGLLGQADDVLGDEFTSPRFVSPGAPRAAWGGIEVAFK